ncbi:hypothetical protein [Malaciobacter marinus]|uniref:hypothetical protein n=1 Tax=Malaciobacter marinus TaxID=505249 RepID=UPI003AFF88D9
MNDKQRVDLLKNEIKMLIFQQMYILEERERRIKEIENIQTKCEHNFELQGYCHGAVFECKKCGFVGGA